MKTAHRITDSDGNVSQYIDRSRRSTRAGRSGAPVSLGPPGWQHRTSGRELIWNGTPEAQSPGAPVYLVHMAWEDAPGTEKPGNLHDHLILYTP